MIAYPNIKRNIDDKESAQSIKEKWIYGWPKHKIYAFSASSPQFVDLVIDALHGKYANRSQNPNFNEEELVWLKNQDKIKSDEIWKKFCRRFRVIRLDKYEKGCGEI